jgi:hypothetical protein
MIEQYLPNNNEKCYSVILQKKKTKPDLRATYLNACDATESASGRATAEACGAAGSRQGGGGGVEHKVSRQRRPVLQTPHMEQREVSPQRSSSYELVSAFGFVLPVAMRTQDTHKVLDQMA